MFKLLGFKNAQFSHRLSFFCHATQFPGKAFMVSNFQPYGPPMQIPEVSAYYPLSAIFYVGHDMKEKKFFDAWLGIIENPKTWDYNYFDDYTTDISIYQMGDLSPIPPGKGFASKLQNMFNQGLEYGAGIAPFIPGGMEIFGRIANFPNTILDKLNDKHGNNTVVKTLNNVFGTQYVCRVVKAYPISVEPLELGYGMMDSIHALRVTFAYHYWANNTIEEVQLEDSNSALKFDEDSIPPNTEINTTDSKLLEALDRVEADQNAEIEAIKTIINGEEGS